jgi:hypothetical protein
VAVVLQVLVPGTVDQEPLAEPNPTDGSAGNDNVAVSTGSVQLRLLAAAERGVPHASTNLVTANPTPMAIAARAKGETFQRASVP